MAHPSAMKEPKKQRSLWISSVSVCMVQTIVFEALLSSLERHFILSISRKDSLSFSTGWCSWLISFCSRRGTFSLVARVFLKSFFYGEHEGLEAAEVEVESTSTQDLQLLSLQSKLSEDETDLSIRLSFANRARHLSGVNLGFDSAFLEEEASEFKADTASAKQDSLMPRIVSLMPSAMSLSWYSSEWFSKDLRS